MTVNKNKAQVAQENDSLNQKEKEKIMHQESIGLGEKCYSVKTLEESLKRAEVFASLVLDYAQKFNQSFEMEIMSSNVPNFVVNELLFCDKCYKKNDVIEKIEKSDNPYQEFFEGKYLIEPFVDAFASLQKDSADYNKLVDFMDNSKDLSEEALNKSNSIISYEKIIKNSTDFEDVVKNSKLVSKNFLFEIFKKANGDLSNKSKVTLLVVLMDDPSQLDPALNIHRFEYYLKDLKNKRYHKCNYSIISNSLSILQNNVQLFKMMYESMAEAAKEACNEK